MSQWQQIWEKRTLQTEHSPTLQELIALDGFDSGAGRIDLHDWQEYTRLIIEQVGIGPWATVYEVGCGAGALLYAMQDHQSMTVGGLDYASGLIKAARKAMPNGDFIVQSAQDLDVQDKYDFVIANSVFHYLDPLSATEVLRRMWVKSNKAIAILDVPHAHTKEACERMRRDVLTEAEYERKYKGLEHHYYTPEWFADQVPGAHFTSLQSFVPNYAQSKYRFSVILNRPEFD